MAPYEMYREHYKEHFTNKHNLITRQDACINDRDKLFYRR